jgi:uncharacterized protein (TIGR01777 family)
MRVAITGSSGLIGTELSRRLAAAGHEVVRVLRGDLGSAPVVWQPKRGWVQEGALEGCDAVVHLGGVSIGDKRWTAKRKQALRASRIESTRLLVGHLGTLTRKPSVFVCASAVGFYGDRGDEVLTEDAPPGEGFLAELVQGWEREARRAEELGVRVVSVRSAPVQSLKGGGLPKMLTPFKLGVGGRLGSGRQWMPWITLEDEARAIEWVLTHEELRGPVNLASPHAVTNAEFTKALGRQIHRPTLFPVPRFALRLMFGQLGEELLLFSQRVVPSKLLASGFRFEYPGVDEALAAALGKRGEPVEAEPATPAAPV